MDHLSKQQLVLLALLVSFMTSLATGIVTVSLMDQAPQGVTRTVSQVIEKTIQEAAPQDASVGTVTLNVDDQLANAVAKVSSSVVKIEDTRSNAIVGLGLVVSQEGIIMVDKSIVSQSYGYSNPGYSVSNYSAILSDGTVVSVSSLPISAALTQTNSDIVFLEPSSLVALSSNSSAPASSQAVFTPITVASSFNLGQSVFSIAGTSTAILGQGVIGTIASSSSLDNVSSSVGTSIQVAKTSIGSPLFDVQGDVIGIKTSSLVANSSAVNSSDDGTSFSPIAPLMAAIPVLK
jgi:hypothetical protein